MNHDSSHGVFVTAIQSGKLPSMETYNGWISVDERLPPNDLYVLVAKAYRNKNGTGGYFVQIAARMNRHWIDDHNGEVIKEKDTLITYWMPLPDKPDEV